MHKVSMLTPRSPAYLGLLLVVLAAAASSARGDTFRVELPQLEGGLPVGQSPTFRVDFGTSFADITSIQVQISGSHTEAWWVGDGVETFGQGPVGNYLSANMNESAGYAQPGIDSPWFGAYFADVDGQFTTTIQLGPFYDTGWSFLKDGVTDLSLDNEGVMGWGRLTTLPDFQLTSVAVVVEGTAAPEPSTLALLGVGIFGVLGIARLSWLRRR